MTSLPIARKLAKYIVDFSYDDIPQETIAAAKGAILDQLGIMLMGSTLPWTRPSFEVARLLASQPESTILGHGEKVSAVDAAMVNSNFAHSCEFDDTGYNGGTHAGSISVPAALALAEARHLPGRDVIRGVVLGYEVLYMIGRVLTRPISEIGFHAQSLVGPFGAATVASTLLHMPEDQVVHALSIAGSHSSGTMEYDQGGGEVKRFHSGMATRGGLVSALLSQHGLTGPETILEGKRGHVALFARLSPADAEVIASGMDGKDWFAIQGRIVKAYPMVGTVPTSIQAVSYLAEEHAFSAEDIERIDVWINPHAVLHGGAITHPRDTIGAQFSLAFGLGVRLVRGNNDLRHYMDPEAWEDPAILKVGSKLHLHEDLRYGRENDVLDWDRYWGARAQVTLKDGRSWTREEMFRKGAPQNPLTQEELEDKFRSLATARLDDDTIEQVVAVVNELDELEDASELTGLLTG